jgi:hypothetical protein
MLIVGSGSARGYCPVGTGLKLSRQIGFRVVIEIVFRNDP